MKKVFAAAAIAATVLTGSALPSYAAATTPAVSLLDGSFSGTAPTVSAPGYDLFLFSIPFLGSYTVEAQLGTASRLGTSSSRVTFTAFDFLALDGTTVLEQGDIGTSFGKSVGNLDPITLAGGDYYIGVRAVGGNNSANTGYSGTLTVSQVPLPNSVALFGVALAGLGVAGAVRKKSKSVQASV